MSKLLQGTAVSITQNGAAAVRCQDDTLFVHGVLPGEIVICEPILNANKLGKLIEIQKASPERVDVLCPYYGNCGGCSLRHLNYQAQLSLKIELLCDALKRAACPVLPLKIPIHESQPDGYRDRVQFHRAEDTPKRGGRRSLIPQKTVSKNKIGFMERASNNVISVEDCLVLNGTIRAAMREGRLLPPIDRDRWTVYGRNDLTICEGGVSQGCFELNANGNSRKLKIDAHCFFQCNSALLQKLISRLMDITGEAFSGSGDFHAADFYSGIGTFSLFLRRYFNKIDLIEINRESILLARENFNIAFDANFDKKDARLRFFDLSDADWVKRHGKKSNLYDFICVDPGRTGLCASMRRWLCAQKKAIIAYISCEPASFARDAREIINAGFSLQSLEIFDFYPQTSRIETLAVFKTIKRPV